MNKATAASLGLPGEYVDPKILKVSIGQGLRLDIGCGPTPQDGYVGIDKVEYPGENRITMDIEQIPWEPFPDRCCTVALLSHVMEHIKPWLVIDVMNELWRIMRPDGLALISTPYAGSFRHYQDPTHCQPWNEETPFYFCKDATAVPMFAIKDTNEGKWYHIYRPKPWKMDRLVWNQRQDLECAIRKMEE